MVWSHIEKLSIIYSAHTRAKPFLARPETISAARSAHKPAASLAARAECSFA